MWHYVLTRAVSIVACLMAPVSACSASPPTTAVTADTDSSPTDAAMGERAVNTLGASAATVWNERARFLAGLSVPESSPLAGLEQTKLWQDHQKTMDADWTTLGSRLAKMDTWARAELDPRINGQRPLIYLFGGPDALAPILFFPTAASYLLAGLEPVGQVAPPETLDDKTLNEALDGVAYALRTTVRASFFRTNEMKRDLTTKANAAVRGVLPILLLFVARADAAVLEVARIEIDANSGATTRKEEGEADGAGIPAVRLTIQKQGVSTIQTLTYVRIDLSNDALAKTPGFLAFARQYAPGNALLKAASFMLDNSRFSTTRDFLFANAAAMLQDDSGVPFRFFTDNAWDYTCFGQYARPRPPFQRHFQADLATACSSQPVRPLTFLMGYRRAEDTNLFLATKASP